MRPEGHGDAQRVLLDELEGFHWFSPERSSQVPRMITSCAELDKAGFRAQPRYRAVRVVRGVDI